MTLAFSIAGGDTFGGLHIHAGTSCTSAGGHFFNQAAAEVEDPWTEIRYGCTEAEPIGTSCSPCNGNFGTICTGSTAAVMWTRTQQPRRLWPSPRRIKGRSRINRSPPCLPLVSFLAPA